MESPPRTSIENGSSPPRRNEDTLTVARGTARA